MNSKKEDEEKTAVINLEALKEDLNEEPEEESSHEKDFLEFGASKTKLYLFEHKTTFFKEHKESLTTLFEIISLTEIGQIAPILKEDSAINVAFFYNDTPSIVNAILKQINANYPQVNSIIVAKSLSAKKAQEHQKSPFGAKHYFASDESLAHLKSIIK